MKALKLILAVLRGLLMIPLLILALPVILVWSRISAATRQGSGVGKPYRSGEKTVDGVEDELIS